MNPTTDTDSTEIVGWLISRLVEAHNDQIAMRQDLERLLGVELLMPPAIELPERIHSACVNDAIRQFIPPINDAIRLSVDIAEQRLKAHTLSGAVSTTAVRRVERDEHGRIARIIDEAVTS